MSVIASLSCQSQIHKERGGGGGGHQKYLFRILETQNSTEVNCLLSEQVPVFALCVDL